MGVIYNYSLTFADMDKVRVALGVDRASKAWDADAPALYCGQSDTGEYVVARYTQGYVVTNVSVLRSVTIHDPPSDDDIERLNQLKQSASTITSVPAVDMKSSTTSTLADKEIPLNAGEKYSTTVQSVGKRDPNAPPDFEDEYQALKHPKQHQSGSFAYGDRDLYPLGKNPPLQPTLPGPFSGDGGTNPRPFGMGQPPYIRHDPPYPGAPEDDDELTGPLGDLGPNPQFRPLGRPPGSGGGFPPSGGFPGFGGGFI